MGIHRDAAKKRMWEMRWALYSSMSSIPLIAVFLVLREGGGLSDAALAAIVSTLTTGVISAPLIWVIHRWARPSR